MKNFSALSKISSEQWNNQTQTSCRALSINTGTLCIKTSWLSTLFKIGFLSLLCLLFSKQISAQNIQSKTKTESTQTNDALKADQTIKGVVKSQDNNELLPGTTIFLKGSGEGTLADESGRFEFPRKLKEGDVLVFSFIGYEMQEYVITKEVRAEIEIKMINSEITMVDAAGDNEIYSPKESNVRKWLRKVKGMF